MRCEQNQLEKLKNELISRRDDEGVSERYFEEESTKKSAVFELSGGRAHLANLLRCSLALPKPSAKRRSEL